VNKQGRLSPSLASQFLSPFVSSVSQPQGQALRDVEKALQIFENTRKIPTSVIEARYCVLLNPSYFYL